MRSQTPQNKKPCEGWGDVTGQEIIGRRTLWDINGFICSDSVSCHVSLELLFSFSSPQNPGRNNLGSWQSWNLHQEKKTSPGWKLTRFFSGLCLLLGFLFQGFSALLALWFPQYHSPSALFRGKSLQTAKERPWMGGREKGRTKIVWSNRQRRSGCRSEELCSLTPWISLTLLVLYLLVLVNSLY